MKDNTVIVLDNSNYKTSYAEPCPFKATVKEKYDYEFTHWCEIGKAEI